MTAICCCHCGIEGTLERKTFDPPSESFVGKRVAVASRTARYRFREEIGDGQLEYLVVRGHGTTAGK